MQARLQASAAQGNSVRGAMSNHRIPCPQVSAFDIEVLTSATVRYSSSVAIAACTYTARCSAARHMPHVGAFASSGLCVRVIQALCAALEVSWRRHSLCIMLNTHASTTRAFSGMRKDSAM